MILTIKTDDENLIAALQSVAKLGNAKIEYDGQAKQWQKESKKMIKDYKAGKIKAYKSAKEMHEAIFNEI